MSRLVLTKRSDLFGSFQQPAIEIGPDGIPETDTLISLARTSQAKQLNGRGTEHVLRRITDESRISFRRAFKNFDKGNVKHLDALDITGDVPSFALRDFSLIWGNAIAPLLEEEIDKFVDEFAAKKMSSFTEAGENYMNNQLRRSVKLSPQDNPIIEEALSQRIEDLKALMKETQRKNEQTMFDALSDNILLFESVDELRELMDLLPSLTPTQTTAIISLYRNLKEQEVSKTRAMKMAQDKSSQYHHQRADIVNDTEGGYLYNIAAFYVVYNHIQAQNLPVTVEKAWLTARDEKICRICRQLHEQVVGVLQAFPTNFKFRGIPQSTLAGGAHARCRCTIVYQVR